MGIREDQHMGLHPNATALVTLPHVHLYDEKIERLYPNGLVEEIGPKPVFGNPVKTESSGKKYSGMFDNEYDLMKYALPNGTVLVEDVQASPWSSGPMFFLALKDVDGNWVKESLWPEDEIEGSL